MFMEYYLIYKTDKKKKLDHKIAFGKGYNFVKRIAITIYNKDMISYILTKKFNTSLKKIIALYLRFCEEGEESGESTASLAARVEFLRSVLLEEYAIFLDKKVVENYLNKLEKLENKIGRLQVKKSRSL